MAAGAMPGAGFPFHTLTVAVSPMTKISGCPGAVRSDSTFTRPALSAGAPSHAAAGDARTPAAHRITSAATVSPPILTPLELHSVTAEPSRTSTPRRAAPDAHRRKDLGAKAGSSRGPASINSTRACRVSKRRNSPTRFWYTNSTMAPANSTPVGPPPTMAKVSSAARRAGSVSRSARSSDNNTRGESTWRPPGS